MLKTEIHAMAKSCRDLLQVQGRPRTFTITQDQADVAQNTSFPRHAASQCIF